MFLLILFVIIGVVTVLSLLLDSIWSICQYAAVRLKPFFQPDEVQSLTQRFGEWALVTGSTDGIGLHYARELARQGLSIVLVSRTLSKLEKCANDIQNDYKVKTKIIQADFSIISDDLFKNIEREIENLNIGILVNNVGKQYTYPTYFEEVPVQELKDIININVGSVTFMTRILLPKMKERGRGAIVNVSSGSELQPLPLMAVYAATKSYVGSFTQAIQMECKNTDIFIQHLSPLFVSTKMNAFSDRLLSANIFVPNPDTYARHAVSTLGSVTTTTGYWAHGIQYFLASVPPVWIRSWIGYHMNRSFMNEYLANMKIKTN